MVERNEGLGRVGNVVTEDSGLKLSKVNKLRYLVCETVKNSKTFIMFSSRRRKAVNDIIPKPRGPLPLVNQLGHSVSCKAN